MKADMPALLAGKPRSVTRSTALPKLNSVNTRAPLESMRVPKPVKVEASRPSIASSKLAIDLPSTAKVEETKALLADEESEWQSLLARAKAETAAAEDVEWAAMRERAAAATRLAEEREWSELIARARSVRTPSLSPWPSPIAQKPREQPRIVLWP